MPTISREWPLTVRLREGRTNGTDLRWHVTDDHREAADVIDKLTAVVEAARDYVDAEDRHYDAMHGCTAKYQQSPEAGYMLREIDAALSLVRQEEKG